MRCANSRTSCFSSRARRGATLVALLSLGACFPTSTGSDAGQARDASDNIPDASVDVVVDAGAKDAGAALPDGGENAEDAGPVGPVGPCGSSPAGTIVDDSGAPVYLGIGCDGPYVRCWVCPVLRRHPDVAFTDYGTVDWGYDATTCTPDMEPAYARFAAAANACEPAVMLERKEQIDWTAHTIFFIVPQSQGDCAVETVRFDDTLPGRGGQVCSDVETTDDTCSPPVLGDCELTDGWTCQSC